MYTQRGIERLFVLRLHEREVLALPKRFVFQESKETFPESESAGRRHTMFEHLHEIPLWHHRFIVSCSEEFLLHFESGSLVERVIEFREPVSNLASCNDRLEALYSSWVLARCLCERRDDLRMIDEEGGTGNGLPDIFPESIGQSFSVISLVLHSEFLEF